MRVEGNPAPAVAPAMLVGAAVMRYTIRRRVTPGGIAIWWGILAFAALCGAAFDGARQPLVQLAQAAYVLSPVWIQLAALLVFGLIVPGLRRDLAPSETGTDLAVQSPIGFGSLSREDLRKGLSAAASALGTLVFWWYFFPGVAELEFFFMLVWFVTLGGAICNWWESAVHVQLSRDWIFGIAQDRKELGRRAAVRVVWMSLPFLVLGTGGSAIHALLIAPGKGRLLDEVLLVHVSGLLVATSLCLLTRRLPPSRDSSRWAGWLVGLGGGVCGFLTFFEYDGWHYAVLALALIGVAVLTVFLGGRALAGAEIRTEVPVSRRGEVR